MQKIGITERGDAGIDFSWVDKLLSVNIIISKNLNDGLINQLLDHKEKIIFHMTCTGYGGTILEPNVPTWVWTHSQVKKLIDSGFPASQIVLRIDPIIPTQKGIAQAEWVLNIFRGIGIERVRYSFLDLYPHVKERFKNVNIKLPYPGFQCSQSAVGKTLKMMKSFEQEYSFESCVENTLHQCGCISQKDIDILGAPILANTGGFQRKGCMCAAGKTELLTSKKRCPHQCLYCYWKD